MLLHLNSSFLHVKFLVVLYSYVSVKSIILSLIALNTILLTSSVNTLCFFFLNHC